MDFSKITPKMVAIPQERVRGFGGWLRTLEIGQGADDIPMENLNMASIRATACHVGKDLDRHFRVTQNKKAGVLSVWRDR